MKKTNQILSIAALAIVGTLIMGCTKEDYKPLVPDTDDDKVVTLKTTVSLEGGSQTRALEDNGTEVVKKFAVDDQITVIYKNTSNETASAVSAKLTTEDIHNNGKTATFTVTMTNPKPEGKLRYIYPANMAKATISATTDPSDDEKTINYNELGTQDGTLAGSKYDLAVYDGSLTSIAELPVSVEFANPLVLCAFTLKSSGSSINDQIKSMTISDNTHSYVVNRTTFEGKIYVAIRPTTAVLQIIATDGTHGYSKSVTSREYVAGNGYPFSLKMDPEDSYTYHDLSVSSFTGSTDAYIFQSNPGIATPNTITIADGKTVKLAGVNINVSSDVNAIKCNGNATIVLSGTNVVENSYSGGFVTKAVIKAGSSGTLTICGEGQIDVAGNINNICQAAVIGSDKDGSCGNIVISGGTINIKADNSFDQRGAAIGAGQSISSSIQCGNISISGGSVDVTIRGGGAGIGGGQESASYKSCCGLITISGGYVRVLSVSGAAAAIGSGSTSYGKDEAISCAGISITEGTVIASTSGYGAAIGSGYNNYTKDNDHKNKVGSITISGGNVTATAVGNYAAGIGSGYQAECGDISISGGSIIATGGQGAAGIGCGMGRRSGTSTYTYYYSKCGNITIYSTVTKVTATKGTDAQKCIGLGKENCLCGTVTIGGSTTVDTSGSSYTYQP